MTLFPSFQRNPFPPGNPQGFFRQPYQQQAFPPYGGRSNQQFNPPYYGGGQGQFYSPPYPGGQGPSFFPPNFGGQGQSFFPPNTGGQGQFFSNHNSSQGRFGNLPNHINTLMGHAGTINNGLNMMRQFSSLMGLFR